MVDHEGEIVLADERKRLLCFEYLPEGSLEKQITGKMMWHVFGSMFKHPCNTKGGMVDHEGEIVLADERKRLLCFEYLPEGSLEKQITDAPLGHEWRMCYQIMNAICDSLFYLHRKKIVQLDTKPTNILLDDVMIPKLTDYGLSRCFDKKQISVIPSNLVGAIGYLAPEFYASKLISFKSDMYSLGVIIIEIVTREKGYAFPDGAYGKVYKGVHNCGEIAVKKLYSMQGSIP